MDDPNKPEKPTRAVNWLMLMAILSLIIGVIGFYLYISGTEAPGPKRRFRDAPIRSFPKFMQQFSTSKTFDRYSPARK